MTGEGFLSHLWMLDAPFSSRRHRVPVNFRLTGGYLSNLWKNSSVPYSDYSFERRRGAVLLEKKVLICLEFMAQFCSDHCIHII